LKSHSWPQQEPAVRSVNEIDFQTASGNELFVLGRNIYQAADGNCYACHRFIDGFSENSKIPTQEKLHILNSMTYEIYFDSSNKIRPLFKLGYYQKIIDYLEQAEFYGSRDFIAAKLNAVSDRPIYIPGQNEAMEFVIQTHSEDMGRCVDDITYHGKSVFMLSEREARGEAKGEIRGIEIGELRMLVKQVKNGRLTIEEAAEDAAMSVEKFRNVTDDMLKEG